MNNRRHNRRGWFYVTNEVDAFTREDHRGIEIVPFGCPRIARRLSGEAFLQFRLAPVPLPGKRILQRPSGVPPAATTTISNGRGLAAALILGAQGALLGTRFLASDEALTSAAAKAK